MNKVNERLLLHMIENNMAVLLYTIQLSVEDQVRISKHKMKYSKGFTPN